MMTNRTAEMGLIGCILLDPVVNWQQAANAGVNGEWFFDEQCLKAWGIFASMDRRLINTQMVLEESRRRDDNIAQTFLNECIDTAPEPLNIVVWLELLRNCLIRRRIKQASIIISSQSEDAEKEPAELLAEVQARLHETIAGVQNDKSRAEVYDEIIDGWISARDRGGIGIKTSWPSMNALIGGYRNGKVYIVAARPGGGKSTLVSNEAVNCAKQGIPVSIASIEMAETEMRGRILASESELSSYSLDTGFYDMVDIDKMRPLALEHAELPIRINDKNMTIDQLCAWIQFEVLKYKAQLVIVDYLQIITGNRRHESRNMEVTSYMTKICEVAKSLDVPIIVLSQLSRSSEHEGRAPELHDLRDSGSIEQGAYAVIFIHHDTVEESGEEVSRLIVAKNRGGPGGSVKIKFERNRQRFVE